MHEVTTNTGARAGLSGHRAAGAGAKHHFRSFLLGWTDPESGDRYDLDLAGGTELIDGLQSAGFEVIGATPEGVGRDRQVARAKVAGRISSAVSSSLGPAAFRPRRR